ncbi:MAG TPA: DUF1579 family protein [Longimicrobiaceae bacterium]|nr:DUF1579 family protein [Longimicrobiaceae bacterium]
MSDNQGPPQRGPQHEALAVFLGRWRAEGYAYGRAGQSREDPRGQADEWHSTHTAAWHTGEFFLVQDERATVGGHPFDTLSIIGVDVDTGRYFARCFENHGFYRRYDVAADGAVWTFTGVSERARIEFSPDGGTQTITWEWCPDGQWMPLCDRVATRIG